MARTANRPSALIASLHERNPHAIGSSPLPHQILADVGERGGTPGRQARWQ
jgi:hypothetical protein